MTKVSEDADLMRKLAATRPRPHATVTPEEAAATIERVLASLSGELSLGDLKLYRELEQLARYIQCARREIADIHPRDISEEHIPMATDELDAVVDHTATATGTILDAAESLERLAPALPAEAAATIAAAVTRIYEACNFQDITGQRITKVVTTLKYIDGKIDAMLAAFGEPAAAQKIVVPPPPVEDDRRLMNGPQLPANAINQDDVDAILAGFDKQ